MVKKSPLHIKLKIQTLILRHTMVSCLRSFNENGACSRFDKQNTLWFPNPPRTTSINMPLRHVSLLRHHVFRERRLTLLPSPCADVWLRRPCGRGCSTTPLQGGKRRRRRRLLDQINSISMNGRAEHVGLVAQPRQ